MEVVNVNLMSGTMYKIRREISIEKYRKEMSQFSFYASVVYLRENAFCIINKTKKKISFHFFCSCFS